MTCYLKNVTKTFVCSTRTTCPRLKYKKLCELVSGDHLDPYLLRWLNCTTFKHKRLWSSGSGKGTAKAPPMDLRICTPCPFQPDTKKRDDLWTSLHTFDLRPHSNHLFIYKISLCVTQFGLQLNRQVSDKVLVNLFYSDRFSTEESPQLNLLLVSVGPIFNPLALRLPHLEWELK